MDAFFNYNLLAEGWLAIFKGYNESTASLFHRICLPQFKKIMQLMGLHR
jgi:hypothetical protein